MQPTLHKALTQLGPWQREKEICAFLYCAFAGPIHVIGYASSEVRQSDAHLGLAKGNNPSSYYYMKFFSLFTYTCIKFT